MIYPILFKLSKIVVLEHCLDKWIFQIGQINENVREEINLINKLIVACG